MGKLQGHWVCFYRFSNIIVSDLNIYPEISGNFKPTFNEKNIHEKYKGEWERSEHLIRGDRTGE